MSEISFRPIDNSVSNSNSNSNNTVLNSPDRVVKTEGLNRFFDDKGQNVSETKQNAPISKEELEKKIDEVNKALKGLNTTLHFALHEETKMLMVRLMDMEDNKVLKEFPPKEYLDTISKIRKMIGVFLDAKV